MNGMQTANGTLLETQARRLEALAGRVEQARLRLPHRTDLMWRGPAAIVCGLALDHLATEFAIAQQQLLLAASASRRAAATVPAETVLANG